MAWSSCWDIELASSKMQPILVSRGTLATGRSLSTQHARSVSSEQALASWRRAPSNRDWLTLRWARRVVELWLDLPRRLGEPVAEGLFGRFGFGRVAAVFLAAIPRRPFPDHETAEPGDAVEAPEEAFIKALLNRHVDRDGFLGVVPGLAG